MNKQNLKLYTRYPDPTLAGAKAQKQIYYQQLLRRDRSGDDPANYAVLPFMLHDLPGSQWRNVHTCGQRVVSTLGNNRWDRMGPDPGLAGFSIGLWRGDRFCIEHWVRSDDLSPEEQVNWALEYVKNERARLHKALADLALSKSGHLRGTSVTYQTYKVTTCRQSLDRAREQLLSLTQHLGHTLDVDVKNIGAAHHEQLWLL